MGSDTYSRHDAPEPYWQRRVYILIALFITVGLVAWACSSSGGKKSTAQIRNAGLNSPTPTPTVSQPTTVFSLTPSPSASPGDKDEAKKGDGDACQAPDVVINLTTADTSYRRKEPAAFTTSVVNAGDHACTFDVGPKNLEVRVTSGSDRVWSSSRCLRKTSTDIQMLKRGVPYMVDTKWDRRRSPGGCSGSRLKAQPGTYAVTAKAGKLKTKKTVFRLR